MSNYAIFRWEKITHKDKISANNAKAASAVRIEKNQAKGKDSIVGKNMNKHIEGSLNHLFREIDTPNADEERTPKNVILKGANNAADVMNDIESKMPNKVRSNAVRMVEFFVGGSPEAMSLMTRDEQIAYFKDAVDFIGRRFGGADNVVSAVVHYDESTPHLSVMLVPLDGKKLNAAKYLNGKHISRQLQTDFAKEVGEKYGLRRGVEKVKPRDHIEVKTFYSVMASIREELRSNKSEADKLERVKALFNNIDYLNAMYFTDKNYLWGELLKIDPNTKGSEVDFANEVMEKLNESIEEESEEKGIFNKELYIKTERAKDILCEVVVNSANSRLIEYQRLSNEGMSRLNKKQKELEEYELKIRRREEEAERRIKNAESERIRALKQQVDSVWSDYMKQMKILDRLKDAFSIGDRVDLVDWFKDTIARLKRDVLGLEKERSSLVEENKRLKEENIHLNSDEHIKERYFEILQKEDLKNENEKPETARIFNSNRPKF